MTKSIKVLVGFLTAALFSLNSCIPVDNTLGSALVPTNQDISIHSVEFDLPVELRMCDSLQTSVSSSVTVGAIRSKDFGLFHSDGAMTITADTDSIIWGDNPIFQQMYLTLTLDGSQTLSDDQSFIPQNFRVYQMNRVLDSTDTYNNCLGPDDYNHTPVSKGTAVVLGGDVEIQLTEEFGRKFFQYNHTVLDSAELFAKQFPGLYITCDDPEEGIEGGRLNGIDLSSSFAYLTYETRDDNGDRIIKTASFGLGDVYCVNVSRSSAGSLVTDKPEETIYMEGLCGVKPFIQAKKVRSMITDWAAKEGYDLNTILIAKATLEFPFEYDTADEKCLDNFPANLFPCQRKSVAGYRYYSPIDEINDPETYDNGSANRSLLFYRPDVALFIQSLIRTPESSLSDSDDIWMMPTLTYQDSNTGTTSYFADYNYYTQCRLNGTGAERHPKLKITYSVLK